MPSTKKAIAVRCQFDNTDFSRDDIVIVDTPSFHTYLHDAESVLKQWVGEK